MRLVFSADEHTVLEGKGIVLAVADGVSSAEAGKEASNTAISRFLSDYYQTPRYVVGKACGGQKILSSINLTLFKRSHEFASEEKGYLTTFTALVLKSQLAHFFHAGDSRAYLYRAGKFKQLTRDHVASIGSGRSFLARAMVWIILFKLITANLR